MKKLLFMVVVVVGGSMLIRGGHVTITPDNQVKIVGWAVPIPEAVQNSPVMGIVTAAVRSQLPPQQATQSAQGAPQDPRYGAVQYVRPAAPNVTSAIGTYSASAPTTGARGGAANAADPLAAVAKALR